MQPRAFLITGAARRIGAAIAQALHSAGANVLLHCHRSRAEAAGSARDEYGFSGKRFRHNCFRF